MIRDFVGNPEAVQSLERMLESGRIPQTLLLTGPEGVGKATLARRFAALLLGDARRVEADDLSLAENQALIGEREKWPAEKRTEDPLMFASHPDFVTFPPDGPLRQISIQQVRSMREQAQLKPLKGARRVFLIDRVDRANEQAANSLLKVLEEPPDHLIIFLTADNPQDVLPTIRSRSVQIGLGRLNSEEIAAFLTERKLSDPRRRGALANGSPGVAVSLDLETWDKRRAAMMSLLRTASGRGSMAEWSKMAESMNASRSEKLEGYLEVLYVLLEDVLFVQYGHVDRLRNPDLRQELSTLASAVDLAWLRRTLTKVDELSDLLRRNIQKGVALDGLVAALRN